MSITAKDILDQRFDKAFNGYKADDVDDYLKEVAAQMGQLQKDYSEQEKKLEVLANKIRDYREEEDAIKEALLGAQKQGNALQAAAREKARVMLEEAKNKSDEMLADAKKKSETMVAAAEKDTAAKRDEGTRIINNAKSEKERILSEAEVYANDIRSRLEGEKKMWESVIAKTKKESDNYRERLVSVYQKLISYIGTIDQECENEFVRDIAAKKPAPAPAKTVQPAPVKEQPAPTKEAAAPEKPAVVAAEPAFEPEKGEFDGKTAEMRFEEEAEKKDDKKNGLFFRGKGEREAVELKFGGKNDSD